MLQASDESLASPKCSGIKRNPSLLDQSKVVWSTEIPSAGLKSVQLNVRRCLLLRRTLHSEIRGSRTLALNENEVKSLP